MAFPKIGIFAFATLAAFSATQAGISGTIVDESATPVHNAAVTVRTLPKLIANVRTLSNDKGAFKLGNAKKGQSIVVRKAGFLPETLSVVPSKTSYGNITLKRDPIENRIHKASSGTYRHRSAYKGCPFPRRKASSSRFR